MYTQNQIKPTSIKAGTFKQGETIEQKVKRIQNNKEPISDGAPLIYTERKDGVLPEYNVRTDRFDLAIDATETINKTQLAKRQQRIEEQWAKNNPEEAAKKAAEAAQQGKNNGEAESIQGTK